MKWNLYDCTKESVMQQIKMNGKISVSPEYDSLKVQEAASRYNNVINEIKQVNDTQQRALSDEIAALKAEIERKKNKLEKLSEENRNLKTKLDEAGRLKRIEELIEPIKIPVKQLADEMRRMSLRNGESPHTGGDWKKRRFRKWMLLAFVLVAIAVAAVCFFMNSDDSKAKYSSEPQGVEKVMPPNQDGGAKGV